jgi:DNA replication protein DnaC
LPSPIELVDRVCAVHGPYSAKLTIIVAGLAPVAMGCPSCDAASAAREADAARRSAQRLRSAKLKDLLASAAIPKRYAAVTLDDYVVTLPRQRIVQTICQTFARTWPEQYRIGGCLVLTGITGTGKTMLACAIGNSIMAEFQATVAYGIICDLLREVKATYRSDSRKTEKQALAELEAPDLLIIDEVCLDDSSTGFEMRMLFEIVNRRYNANRPTIMISNHSVDDLKVLLGPRIMERLEENGVVLALDWPSHRCRGQAA